MLEDSLREMFATKVEQSPAIVDPATVAIRQGRRIRHGRAAATGLAAVLILAVTLGGLLSLREWWEPAGGLSSPVLPAPQPVTPTPTPEPSPWDGGPFGLELRVANQLLTTDGDLVMLNGAGLVERIYRTPDGWVYGSAEHVRLLRDDGALVDLVRGAQQWVISLDGRRLAFTADGAAQVATISRSGLRELARTAVPDGTVAIAFWQDRVLLAAPDRAAYDVWDETGDRSGWADAGAVAAIYGPAGDGLVALVRDGQRHCLALVTVEPDGLRPGATGGCGLAGSEPETPDGERGWLGPDGRWLAVPAGDELRVLDVAATLAGHQGAVSCPRRDQTAPIWWDATTLLTADGSGAQQCGTTGVRGPLVVPDDLGSRWQYVPVLRGSG